MVNWTAIGSLAAVASVLITAYEVRLRRRNRAIKRLEERVRRLDRRVAALNRLYHDTWLRLREITRLGGRRWYDP